MTGLLIKSSSATFLKSFFNAVSTLCEEATFEASAEALTFRSMDPSHVALLDALLENKIFDKYECDKETKFTVRVEDVQKLLRRADKDDSVEISLAPDDLLKIVFDGKYRREFEVHLIDASVGPTPLPKLSFNSKIVVTMVTFTKILSDIQVVADHITIDASAEKLCFSGKSDVGRGSATLEKGHQDLLELKVKEDSKSIYSLDYLVNTLNTVKDLCDVVTLNYSSKMPLKIETKLTEQGGKLDFYLAPRIEEK